MTDPAHNAHDVARDHWHEDRGAHAPRLAGHGPAHGMVDPSVISTGRGLWAVKWSFVGLMVTALLQLVVVAVSGSVALLADTIHNFADAATAIPLAVAFWLTRRATSRRFTYGLGRVEDLSGLAVVLTILASGLAAAWASATRLAHPPAVGALWAVALASAVGFAGNEAVAVFRIKVGREIGSAALIADGHHARADGWTSLAVLGGAAGVWSGYPIWDPLVGLGISAAILWLAWQAGRSVLVRMLDGVEGELLERIAHVAGHVPLVHGVSDVRARWVGHRLVTDVSITVPRDISVVEGHEVAKEVGHQLLHHIPHLGVLNVHVDPAGEGGEHHHRIASHRHDGLPTHSHP